MRVRSHKVIPFISTCSIILVSAAEFASSFMVSVMDDDTAALEFR